MSESDVEQAVAPVYTTFTNPRTTILGAPGQVELHLTAEGASEAEAAGAHRGAGVGDPRRACRGESSARTAASCTRWWPTCCVERGLRLALAESCTGGLLSARLTEVPGSSRFLDRGVHSLRKYGESRPIGHRSCIDRAMGAVSEEVAQAMAAAARRQVGRRRFAWPSPASRARAAGRRRSRWASSSSPSTAPRGPGCGAASSPGSAARVRAQAVQAALEMIRRGLLGLAAAMSSKPAAATICAFVALELPTRDADRDRRGDRSASRRSSRASAGWTRAARTSRCDSSAGPRASG